MNNVRLSKSSVGEEEKCALARVIDTGFLGMGEEVKYFEDELGAFIGTENEVICVNSGTAALHLAIQCLGIGPGDEVLVPSITYVASFQAVAAAGATPVACDVTPDQVFIDLTDAEKRVTTRTRAIMPVHYASDSQNMTAVYDFARHFGLRIIEDAAHAFGGIRNGYRIGKYGDVICFSFDGIKNITSGEGGAIVTGDLELAQRIRDARLLGVERDSEMRLQGKRSWRFDVLSQGYRYHMSNLMAAIGREQLKKFEYFADHRRSCVFRYISELASRSEIEFLDLDYENIVPHIFVVRITSGLRETLMKSFCHARIECGIHYQPNHLLRFFSAGYSLPVSEALGNELLTIPLHAELSCEDQSRVIQTMNTFFNGKKYA